MITVSISTSLTSYIPILLADSIPQGLQVCKLLKEIEPSNVYSVVSSTPDLSLPHVRDYSWKEQLVD